MSAQPLQRWQLAQRGRGADFDDTVADDSATDKGVAWDRENSLESKRSGDSELHMDLPALAPYSSEEDSQVSEESDCWQEAGPCPRALEVVKSDLFSQLVAGAIFVSIIIIAGETDYSELWIWQPLNIIVYTFFTVEIIIRLMGYGASFFCNDDMCWNIFDLSLVVGGWCRLFVEFLVEGQLPGKLKLPKSLMLFRVARILRILRVLRLFKQCSHLMLLANGLMESVQMVFWIMVLMFMFMIIFAIILTDLIGNQSYKFEDPDNIEEYWHGVIKSLITLFQFLTLDNWSDITRQVTDTMPPMRLVFCFYIFMASFAILALLTGVITDHMGTVSDDQQKDEQLEKKRELEVFTNKLRDNLVRSAGMTYNQELTFTREDLRTIMSDAQLGVLLEGYGVIVTDHEIDELFDFLDQNNDGLLTWPEFKAGVFRLREEKPLAWDVLRIRFAAERVAHSLEGGMGEAATLRKLHEVKECMATAEKQLHKMEVWLRGFMDFARQPPRAPAISLLGSFMQPQTDVAAAGMLWP